MPTLWPRCPGLPTPAPTLRIPGPQRSLRGGGLRGGEDGSGELLACWQLLRTFSKKKGPPGMKLLGPTPGLGYKEPPQA